MAWGTFQRNIALDLWFAWMVAFRLGRGLNLEPSVLMLESNGARGLTVQRDNDVDEMRCNVHSLGPFIEEQKERFSYVSRFSCEGVRTRNRSSCSLNSSG